MQITIEEAQFILQLIDRVQLSGKEAGSVAYIQQKLATALKSESEKVEEPKKKDK